MTGPSLGRGLVCAECLKSIKISVPCFSCNIPLCNQSCGDKSNHRLECHYFQNPILQGVLGESDNAQTVLDIILPLRYLLKSEYLKQTVTDLSKGEPWPEPETRQKFKLLFNGNRQIQVYVHFKSTINKLSSFFVFYWKLNTWLHGFLLQKLKIKCPTLQSFFQTKLYRGRLWSFALKISIFYFRKKSGFKPWNLTFYPL